MTGHPAPHVHSAQGLAPGVLAMACWRRVLPVLAALAVLWALVGWAVSLP